MAYDAVVLAGGAARRLDGVDKPMLEVAGRPMLVHVLDAVAAARVRVVVGPRRRIDRDVAWCREDPPGGGPVAGLGAGLPLTTAGTVLVLAADLPGIAPAIDPLLAALPAHDVALLARAGRRNHLAAAWRRDALMRALAGVDDLRGASMRGLLVGATVAEVADPGWGDDCDTWSDWATLRDRRTP
jgi:molybdopterin-guanine dinucleotide biosynthesis protein A